LPRGLQVEIDGQVYGGAARWGWATAGAAVLSLVPAGETPVLRVKSIEVQTPDGRASGLWLLWARSVALRRLMGHVRAMLRG
jgi:hypothetical protein